MAEKVETILSRGVFNTRPRDYYDVYILSTTQVYDKEIFAKAIEATAKHRGTAERIADKKKILKDVSESAELKAMWEKYSKQFSYANDISYEAITQALRNLTLF